MRRALLLLLPIATALGQQPYINYRGVVNAASFMPQGLPGGGIAQGSIFSIFGRNLGPATPVAAAGFPLSSTLSGVSIRVFQGAKAVDALPLFVSAAQINAVMPSGAPTGMVSVQVSRSNARSNPAPVRVVANAFGIFTASSSGEGPGILQNFVSQDRQPVNSLSAPATPGQTITMWGTGLGPLSGPDNAAAPAGTLPTPVEVFVGGQAASVKYSGRSPCCSGVDQITFTVPANAPQGCWVPVMVRTGGATVSNAATMAISTDGSACSEPGNPVAQRFISGGKVGVLSLARLTAHEDVGVAAAIDVTKDLYLNSMTREPGGPFAFAAFVSQPPAGSCTVLSAAGDYFDGDPLQASGKLVERLDFGPPLTLTGPKGTVTLAGYTGQGYSGMLGSVLSLYSTSNTLFLDPGNYTLAGAGGAEVGAFRAAVTVPSAFTWTNRDQISLVDRTQPLTINWSGAPTGQSLALLGGNVDRPTNSTALFYCVAQPGATSFTIPAAILEAIPATRFNTVQSRGGIFLGSMPASNAASFTAPGLDVALVRFFHMIGKTVIFQ